MRLQFCGVRGSTPAPGPEYVRTGGHTSCVLLWTTDGPAPNLVLDAGTGIRTVTSRLGGAAFRGTILLTHLHWDHVHGLPFFTGGDRDDAEVRLLLPEQGVPAATLLDRAMSPPHFPIGTDGLRGRWTFDTISEGTHEIEGCTVTAREVPHKGGRTFGYRIQGRDAVVAYLPDHQPAARGEARDAAIELARDVDLLIHDAQFVAGEEQAAANYGHATIGSAVELATEAGAWELALFHHSPTRTDTAVDFIAETWLGAASSLTVSIAIEGLERNIVSTSGEVLIATVDVFLETSRLVGADSRSPLLLVLERASGSTEVCASSPDDNKRTRLGLWDHQPRDLQHRIGTRNASATESAPPAPHDARAWTSHPPDRQNPMTSTPPHPPVHEQPKLLMTDASMSCQGAILGARGVARRAVR